MRSTTRQFSLSVLLTLFAFGFTSGTTATESPTSRISSIPMAQKIIEDYKKLRNECAQLKDDVHRACVSRLNRATPDYKAAKKVISYSAAPLEQSTYAWRGTAPAKNN